MVSHVSNFVVAVAVALALALIISEWSAPISASPAQTFYPNGRYGKRQLGGALDVDQGECTL